MSIISRIDNDNVAHTQSHTMRFYSAGKENQIMKYKKIGGSRKHTKSGRLGSESQMTHASSYM